MDERTNAELAALAKAKAEEMYSKLLPEEREAVNAVIAVMLNMTPTVQDAETAARVRRVLLRAAEDEPSGSYTAELYRQTAEAIAVQD